MHCPNCGAENFTMEGWEDLDHCSSCGEPLAEAVNGASTAPRRRFEPADAPGGRGNIARTDQDAEQPHPA